MEKLHIYSKSGAESAVRELSDIKGTLFIVKAADGLSIEESPAAGAEVLGALFRDEDGWNLASSDPSRPVTCGAKSAGDVPLIAGAAVSFADSTFLLERDTALSGDVLVWQVDGGKYGVENLLAGRNALAVDASTGKLSINPPLIGEEKCELFVSPAGLEVVVSSGENKGHRLSVAPCTLFAMGGFRGMLMPAAMAAEAMQTGNPFAWPSRDIRGKLMKGLKIVASVFGAAVLFAFIAAGLEARLRSNRGADSVSGGEFGIVASDFEDTLIYDFAFFRAMPQVLGPTVSDITENLIRRGETFSNNVEIARKVEFLKTVKEIQQTIEAERIEDLGPIMEQVDRPMFTYAAADGFLEDVQEIIDYTLKSVPEYFYEISDGGSDAIQAARQRAAISATVLSNNVFCTEGAVQRHRRYLQHLMECTDAYVNARKVVLDALAAPEEKLCAEAVDELCDAEAMFFSAFDDPSYEKLVKRERSRLTDIARRAAERVRKSSDDLSLAALGPVCNLAADTDIPAEEVEVWRKEAADVVARMDKKCRELYQEYRLRSGTDPSVQIKLLDEIIAAGPETNRFRQWAEREKLRLQGTNKEEEGK